MIEVGVCKGYMIYREPNGVGGYRYWSDEVGGSMVWDTCLVSVDTLEFCIADDQKTYQEKNHDDRPR